MAFNFQKVIVILIVCVAVVFISGILLPRFLSNEYFELRDELNSQNGNSKYSSRENLMYISAKMESQNSSPTYSSESTKAIGKFQFNNLSDILPNSFRIPKVKKRSKRRVLPDEHISWNFNLNVSRQNFALEEKIKNASDSLHEKGLGVALYAEGNGEKRTAFGELQNALKSVENFLKFIFFKRMENVTHQGEIKNFIFLEKDKKSKDETHSPNFVNTDEAGNRNQSTHHRGRAGKFLFGTFDIFGFGGKSLDKSTPSPKEETEISTEHEIDSMISKHELMENTSSLNKLVTENSKKLLDIPSEFLVSQAERPETDLFERMNNASETNLVGISEDVCTDCAIGDFELPVRTSEVPSTIIGGTSEKMVQPTKSIFSDEILELFCMSLVNKVEESQQLSDTDENAIKNPSLEISDEPEFQSDVNQRQSRFINFGIFGFGSGRSAIMDEDGPSDTTSEDQDIMALDKLPSISDCENYFREKQSVKMFPKPNLMDMISDPKIELVDFANATISPKLKEHHVQFITGLIKSNLNNTVEAFDKNLEETAQKDTDETIENETVHEEALVEFNVDKVTLTSTDSSEVFETTEKKRDGRFINIFGFGSGSDESIRSERRFFSSFFGSGERSLETSESIVESDRNEGFENEETFAFKTVSFSDDGGTSESENPFLHASASPEERRFWGFIGLGGSGDGRELHEKKETNEATYSENDCENDCSYKVNTTEQLHDCEDYECSFENSHHNSDNENDLRNETDCQQNCYSAMEYGNSSLTLEHSKNLTEDKFSVANCSCLYENSKNATFSECDDCNFNVIHSDDNYGKEDSYEKSTTNSQKDSDSGCYDCEYESDVLDKQVTDFDRIKSFLECDDCNLNVNHAHNDSPEYTDIYQSELPVVDANLSSNEGHGIDCPNCNQDNLSGERKTKTEKNITFSECDDCNFSHTLNDSYETSENFSREFVTEESNLSAQTVPYEYYRECHDCAYEQSNEEISDLEHLNQTYTDTSKIKVKFDRSHSTLRPVTVADNVIDRENSMDSTELQNLHHEQTTEMKPRSFLGTIFLTGGSGDGLFGDSGGPINLIEEESTIQSPIQFPRRGRLDDTLENISEMVTESSSPNESEPTHGAIILVEKESTLPSVIQFSRRRGRLDDILENTAEMSTESSAKQSKPMHSTINLVEKVSTVPSVIQFPRRRGRLDDPLENISEVFTESSPEESEQKPMHDTIHLVEKESTLSPVLFSGRRGRLDDISDPCDDCDDFSELFEKNNPIELQHEIAMEYSTTRKSDIVHASMSETQTKGEISLTNINESTAVSTDIFQSSTLNFETFTQSPPRQCSSARQCNATLNERCIKVNSSLVCDCGRAYVRQKRTRKCVVQSIVQTSVKFPAEEFNEDLRNPFSRRYQQTKRNSIDMMRLLLQDNPKLWSVLAEVDVAELNPGSLIVTWNLVLAEENQTETTKLIEDVKNHFQIALKNESLMQKTSFDARNASLVSVNTLDPCMSSGTNYCSANAYCVWNEAISGKHLCICKDHFRDASTNPRYPGEICTPTCSPEYCGSNGHCEVSPNGETRCLCSGLYFGRRCEVPGVVVLIMLGLVACISIATLLGVVLKKRFRTRSYGGSQTVRSQEIGMHSHMNDKVTDAIALEENAGATVSKFITISTPMPQPPLIKVTRPTINESSLSFDYDSTFDKTSSPHTAQGSTSTA